MQPGTAKNNPRPANSPAAKRKKAANKKIQKMARNSKQFI